MATTPMQYPQSQADAGASPNQGGAPASAYPQQQPDQYGQQGGSQANQLQQYLGQLMQVAKTLGEQNAIIQPEMMEIMTAIRKAFVKTTQASNQQQQPTAPAPQAY